MKEVSNTQFAEQARSSKYDGVPYTKLDCQGFVEGVLKDCGVRKADWQKRWSGSNEGSKQYSIRRAGQKL